MIVLRLTGSLTSLHATWSASGTGSSTGSSEAPAGSSWLENFLVKLGLARSAADSVVQFVWRPLVVILVLVVAGLIAHFGAKAIRRVLGRAADRAAARSDSPRASGRASTVVALVANVFRIFVVVVAVFTVLGMVGIDLTPILASATIIGATLGFGAQLFVRDYLSGFLLTIEDQFGIGDAITVNNVSGVVEDLSLRVTRVRAADGTTWYVPNGDIRTLANSSRGWAKACVDLSVPGAGAASLGAIERSLAEAARHVAQLPQFAKWCTDPPEVLGVVAADETTCTVRVMLRTKPSVRDSLERALRQALLERLATEGHWPVPVA